MRITHRILCGVLTAALTVSLVTSTGVLAADDTVPIDQANFPDAALRAGCWTRTTWGAREPTASSPEPN